MRAEGWYRDPFGAHQDRWFSDGRPTELVRDATGESHDPPPSSTYDGPLEEVPEPEVGDGSDLLRADAAEKAADDPAHEYELKDPDPGVHLYGPD